MCAAQLAKVTSKPASPRNLTAVAFGGVPMVVPIPPTLAATGIESARPTFPLSSSGRPRRTGVSRASIIAAVAVLLMNMENRAMTTRNARRTDQDFLNGFRRKRARVTSRPYLVAMLASTNPPRKSMTTGSAKADIMLL